MISVSNRSSGIFPDQGVYSSSYPCFVKIIPDSTGRTYIYECTSYWDPVAKKPRQKRRYIGVEKADGSTHTPHKQVTIKSTRDYGAIYLLNFLSVECKLKQVLKKVFPKDCATILNLIFFKIIKHDPFYLFETWSQSANLFEGGPVCSQDLSTFMNALGEDEDSQKMFFQKWIEENKDLENLLFDITSISSHSKFNEWLEWGYNRDGESLRQINLGAIVSQKTGIPLAYRFCPGSIPDVSTLKKTVEFAKDVGIKKLKFVLDKGFYSKHNIEALLAENIDFLLPLSFSTKAAGLLVAQSSEGLKLASNAFHYNKELFYHSQATYQVGEHLLNAHIYLNAQRQKDETSNFLLKISQLEELLLNKNEAYKKYYLKEVQPNYAKFFIIKNNSLLRDNDSIGQEMTSMGKIILITNQKLEPIKVLDTYIKKDIVEKYFDQMKNELDEKRLRVGNKNAFGARIFITFLALILRTHLCSKSLKSDLYKQFTVPELLAQLNLIRKTYTNSSYYLSEASKNHKIIFNKLQVPLPS